MPWFDCAIKRPITTNMGGTLSPNYGLILHHAVANQSLWSFFNSPSAQVSAHFWVSLTGVIEQYVDTNVVAWHAKQLNGRYCGVETEGCTQSPYDQPMTAAMISALARLYAEGNKRHGWKYQLINQDGQQGFGYHRMAVNTGCPCDVRVNTRQQILDQAQGGAPPSPSTARSSELIASTSSGKGYWTTTSDGAVYAFGDAQHAGQPFPNTKLAAPIIGIAGCSNSGYWLLAKDGGVFAYGSAQYLGKPDRT